MNTDVIVSWPNNCDYPLWRQFIRENRKRFESVFVVFTQTYQQPNYEEFVRQSMAEDNVTFLNAPLPQTPTADWRNLAVNAALQLSTAEWVWFTEQDFYIEQEVLDNLSDLMNFKAPNVYAVYDAGRMHPCCIFARREVIEKTSKNFGIVPDESDHFSIFQRELEGLSIGIGEIPRQSYFHFNGLSSNCTLLQNGQEPNYQPETFTKYLEDCLRATVPIDPRFAQIVATHLQKQ